MEEFFLRMIADASDDPYIGWAISFEFARCLTSLELSLQLVPNGWLFSIVKGQFPLKSLSLCYAYGFSIEGLVSLLKKHRGIERLECRGVDCLTDNGVSDLSGFLSNVVFVNFRCYTDLSVMAFYYLARACPFLKTVKMGKLNVLEEDSSMHLVIQSQVRSLYLNSDYGLTDQYLDKFLKHCPSLQLLDLTYCPKLSEGAILLVMKRCSEITHLGINLCNINNLEIDFDFPSLEVLRARGVGFDGNALAAIGKRCYNLHHLDLENCPNVSADGVKAVVANCKGLRKINLKRCKQLDVDILSWMVLTRPSLKKIIPPCGFIPHESKRNFYLRHGCLICDGQ